MRITPEQIYDLAGLKVGDKVNIEGRMDNPFTLHKDNLQNVTGFCHSIGLLTDDFEKVESKIWNINEIKEDDRYYFADGSCRISNFLYIPNSNYHTGVVRKGVAFKTHKYAEEYLEKLIEFNEEYKKGCE